MKNKTLGRLAMAGAPFLLVGMGIEEMDNKLKDSWFTGFWGLAYLTGWMCSVIILKRIRAAGNNRFSCTMPWIVFTSLAIANISNLIQLLAPHNKPFYFFYLDLFWPFSHVLMLVYGAFIARAGVISGFGRWLPLICGAWFPFMMLIMAFLGQGTLWLSVAGTYSVIAWGSMAAMLGKMKDNKRGCPGKWYQPEAIRLVIFPPKKAGSLNRKD
jgi:hypothetical protein